MKVELIIPIERLRGKLKQDGYYFRQYRGQQIVQRCPTQWKDTPARKAARLEARVECAEGGMEGLKTLLYGWKRFRKYGAEYDAAH